MSINSNYIRQIASNTAAINKLITDAKKINQLDPMQGAIVSNDLIAIYQASTNLTVRTSLTQFFRGLTSDDVENMSQVSGINVTEALNQILTRTNWRGEWIPTTYIRRDQVNFNGGLYVANNTTTDIPEENGIVSQNWDKQIDFRIIAGANIVVDETNPSRPVISAVPGTSAGVLTKLYFTGDDQTGVTDDSFKVTTLDKGTVAEESQEITSDGDLVWFPKDFISDPTPKEVIVRAGDYSSIISLMADKGTYDEEVLIEVYLSDNNGDVIDSGIPNAPIGSYGVRVIGIMTTGTINLEPDILSERSLTGIVLENFTYPINSRSRYRIGARKAGTTTPSTKITHYFGYDYIGYVSSPVPITTDTVENESQVPGVNASDAINWLDNNKVNKSELKDNFTYVQNMPSDVWSINHNLDKLPSATILDSAGTQVEGKIEYVDNFNITITFNAAFTGKATLN